MRGAGRHPLSQLAHREGASALGLAAERWLAEQWPSGGWLVLKHSGRLSAQLPLTELHQESTDFVSPKGRFTHQEV